MADPKTIQVAFRCPPETVAKIDAYSERMSAELIVRFNRTKAIERLINIALGVESSREVKP